MYTEANMYLASTDDDAPEVRAKVNTTFAELFPS
jgi:hypothetical protein